jgi:two-component system cell cycle sensor histidine kinase/response regulator CckA
MKDEKKTKKQLIEELEILRKQTAEMNKEYSLGKTDEIELRESESKYRTLIETTDTGFVILDRRGMVLDANAEYVRLTGHEQLGEILGRSVVEWTAEQEREKNALEVRKCFETGLVRNLEINYVDKDGKLTPIEINATVIDTKSGSFVLTLCRDITERKRVQAELLESEERFRLAMEGTQQGWFDLNVQTGTVKVSPEYPKLIGYEPEEFNTSLQSWIDAIHPEDRDAVLKTYRECLESGAMQIMEYRRRTKTGEWKWIRSMGKIVGFDSDNKPLRMSGTHADISDRKRAAEALRESEEKYRLVVENAGDAIFIAQDGMIKFPNHYLTIISGYSKEEITGKPFEFFLHTEDKDMVRERHRRRMQGENVPSKYPCRVINKSGNTVWIEVSAVLITWEKRIAALTFLRDITERKLAEEMVSESEARYRTLFENAHDMIQSVGTDGRFLYVNPAWLKTMGYRWDELRGVTIFDVLAPIQRPHCINLFQQIIAGQAIDNLETVFLSKDGQSIAVEGNLNPQIVEGKVVSCYGIFRNITERKKTEEALRSSEEQYRLLFENANEGIVVAQDGMIKFANPRMLEIGGYPYEELTSMPFIEFIHPDDRAMVMERHMQRLKGELGPHISYAYRAITKDGRVKWLEMNGTLSNWQGRIATVNFISDITERKLAEVALTESEQKYRTLFEESKDVIFISTPEGKFADINPAGVELFGYASKEEILKIDIARDLYLNFEAGKAYQLVLDEQGYIKDHEVELMRKDGKHLTVLLTATTIRDETGKISGYRGILKDITDWKRLEQQLLQAQKMEAIGQLAGGIAHDFNNLLTAIIGYGHLLRNEVRTDERMSAYAGEILGAAERAAVLTNDLLTFSRKQIVNPQPVNLNTIIKNMESLLLRVMGEDIELATVLTDADLTIMADSTQIDQILMNLAANAQDAMPKGGSFILSTDRVEISSEFIRTYGYGTPGSYALLSVADSGTGMDEKTRERIFEPFFTTKKVGKGTGLGLSMVYGIVKQHEGYINVYSEPDRGTTFKICLPLIQSAVAEKRPAEVPEVRGGTETILIGEDEPHVRSLLKEVLSKAGYTIIEAVDGDDAIETFNKNKEHVHLLLLDVIMPKKNGKEVYRAIKRIKADINVIFISGYSAGIIHKKGILEVGLDFISKPVLPDELLLKVRNALDK